MFLFFTLGKNYQILYNLEKAKENIFYKIYMRYKKEDFNGYRLQWTGQAFDF